MAQHAQHARHQVPRLQAVVLLHDPPLVLLVIEAHQDRRQLVPGFTAEALQLRHRLAVLLFAQGDLPGIPKIWKIP